MQCQQVRLFLWRFTGLLQKQKQVSFFTRSLNKSQWPPRFKMRSLSSVKDQLKQGHPRSLTSARRHHRVMWRSLTRLHRASMSVLPSITSSSVASELELKETGEVRAFTEELLTPARLQASYLKMTASAGTDSFSPTFSASVA